MNRVARFALTVCLALSVAGLGAAELAVEDAWIRLLPGGAPAGGYFTLRNDTGRPAVLVGASSDEFGHVMMHRTTVEQGRSRMLHVEQMEVPARGKVVFAPGGYHLMLMQPGAKVAVGQRVPITLEFSGGRKLTAQFELRGPAGK